MKTIIEANTAISKILGKQKIVSNNTVYRKLIFCMALHKDDKFIAYNFITRELIEINKSDYDILTEEKIDYSEALNKYIEKWFLVPQDFNEFALLEQVKTTISLFDKKKNINNFTILPTTDCNARCFYCYEAGVKKIYMTPETANDIAEYIIKNCGKDKAKIRWFGGEPLYNLEAIDIICEKLKSSNIEYSSSIVSNGYLFNDSVIKREKELWHLKDIQVTLDGTEKVYNRVKNYIYNDNESPYKIVLNNIEKLLNNDISVVVRLNMDEHNKNDLYNLIDELYERFNGKSNFRIYAHLLFENSGNLKLDYSSPKHLELAYDYFALEDYILSKGLLIERNISETLKITHCMADNDSCVVILPDGKLSKCEHVLSGETIGSIYNDKLNQEIIASWKQQDITESCYNCAVFPDCMRLKKCHSIKPICYKSEQLDMLRKKERMIWKLYEKESN